MQNIYLGRQPIYDRQLCVFAYELLFRSDETNRAHIDDPDRATTELIVNALTGIGLENVVGEVPAFINLTEYFIQGMLPLPGGHEHLILEILETIQPTESVIAGVQRLKKQGYQIALDDFVYHDHLQPLVDCADIVKLDIMNMDVDTLRDTVKRLRQYPLKLLAEKVETQEEFALCQQLGFDYFQGYFFCKPNILKGQHTPSNRLSLIHLLAKISDPEIDTEELLQLVTQDVTLSYRLLRYINSSQYGLNHNIESIKSAILLLGMITVRNLISLLLVTSIHDKPFELFLTAFVRAQMCEQIGSIQDKKHQASYFTVGLFSVMDAIMDKPMADILAQLPLTANVAAAIQHHAGMLGQTLHAVIAYERGEWDKAEMPNFSTDDMRTIYLNALQWSKAFYDSLENTQAA